MPADSKAADSDDAMRVSANNLTIQLFRTVRDVFSNNEEEKAPPPLLSPSDNRGNIAQKLMEGYKFHGGVCAKCINPLMSYKGKVSCIMCMKAEDTRRSTQGADASESLSYIATALASPNGSDLSAEKRAKDKYVSKEMSQFYERRSNANLTYTAKLLDGYHMHSQICSECDMPMMKYEDSVTCVICPPKVKEVAKSVSVTIVESQKEEQLTTAEITVQRLRGVPPKDEDIERELEKAEIELLKLMKVCDENCVYCD
ncbi:hypothetical protein ACHAW5_002373 [Stephanodiscus triporus]|uniref:Uncharacterized protein n=1 Tax=Stephanodiscus triporus TaxID=2934178 RepID=A0ABD3PPS2_9STRA